MSQGLKLLGFLAEYIVFGHSDTGQCNFCLLGILSNAGSGEQNDTDLFILDFINVAAEPWKH